MSYKKNGYKYKMQPIVFDKNGTARFAENRIITKLLDVARTTGYDINSLHMDAQEGKFSIEEIEQFNQLIGYSVSGFGKITCSCSTEKKKQLCKHVIRLIEYNITDLISNNSELLIIAHEWINSNQNYLNAYKEYCDLIWKEREIKTKLNNAKNSLMNIITP